MKEATAPKSERLKRGSFPPYVQLGEAFDLIQKLYDHAGAQASYDLMSRITGNSSSSSSFIKKIGALKSYQLVEEANKVLTLTPLGMAIAAPMEPDSASAAKKQAFLNIENFSKLFERHKGKLLPPDEFLKNIIEQDFSVPRDLSPSWVEAFKNGAAAANLLFTRSDGKTQIMVSALPSLSPVSGASAMRDGDQNSTLATPYKDQPAPGAEPRMDVPISASGHNTRIKLSNGKIAEISVPDHLTPRDAQKIKGALEGMKSIIDSMVEDDTVTIT